MLPKLKYSLCCLMIVVKMAAVLSHEMNHFNSTLADDYGPAEETQHTFCKIATEELQATANATITRELKGVCTTKELKRSMNAIMREIQTLKDALILQASVGGTLLNKHHTSRTNYRNKRKNLLDLFANSNKSGPDENLLIPIDNGKHDGRYSYYWTIVDAEQYLYEGVSLKSPVITFQDLKYFLRLTIVNHVVSVQLIEKDTPQSDTPISHANYAIFVLNKNGVQDLKLDASNAYSVLLPRIRQLKRDTNTLFIKLVVE